MDPAPAPSGSSGGLLITFGKTLLGLVMFLIGNAVLCFCKAKFTPTVTPTVTPPAPPDNPPQVTPPAPGITEITNHYHFHNAHAQPPPLVLDRRPIDSSASSPQPISQSTLTSGQSAESTILSSQSGSEQTIPVDESATSPQGFPSDLPGASTHTMSITLNNFVHGGAVTNSNSIIQGSRVSDSGADRASSDLPSSVTNASQTVEQSGTGGRGILAGISSFCKKVKFINAIWKSVSDAVTEEATAVNDGSDLV